MKKSFKQIIHDFWYVKPYEPNKNEYCDRNGNVIQDLYEKAQEDFIQEARQQQKANRLAVFMTIGLIIAGVCIFLYLFQILLCVGLFLGCIGMLLK